MYKKNNAFTIIELVAVLVILSIVVLILTPIILDIKSKVKSNAYKRSIDRYGKAIELAIANNLIDKGTIPTDVSTLKIEYKGDEVKCNIIQIKENGGVYLSECTVNDIEVKDKKTSDGWYHYNERDITKEEYVVMYGKAIEKALKEYYDDNNSYPESVSSLTIDYKGKKIAGDIIINYDGTIYMSNLTVAGVSIDKTYGSDKSTAVKALLANANPISVTNYEDVNASEMYTFSHQATEQTDALIDYRYIGTNPSNYVTFNNELWRIIGVFTVEGENENVEQRIKIVRNEKLSSNKAWTTNNIRDWASATLNTYLNGDYYNTLNEKSKTMISNTKYYLGNKGASDNSADSFYNTERNTAYSGNSNSWIGKIALIYPSDYSYTYALGVDSACYEDGTYYGCVQSSGKTKGWIFNMNSNLDQWLLIGYLAANGGIGYPPEDNVYSLRPSLFLNSNVKIISGDGSSENSYKLDI